MENKIYEKCGREIQVCGTIFRLNIVPNGDGTYELFASPCTLPSAVFDVATISMHRNQCMQFDFYEFTVYTDPVEIIIDCSICQGIRRAIELYFANSNCFSSNCCQNNNNNNRLFF